MDLNGVRIPAGYNGIGLHDSPGCYAAAWGYAESYDHAQILREHGVHAYKLFVSGTNKVERARAYVDAGIVVIVRNWVDHPWGRPPGQWVMPADQMRAYVDAGVQLFEPGWNEFNLSCEWLNEQIPNAAGIARAVCDAWQVGLARQGEAPGAIMLFPSASPGGNVDHRVCYQAIIAELAGRGLTGTVRHLAIHPRPHNNPPETRWSATNTVTFDEWRWIRDQFPAGVYLWATEHGYSVGDAQNGSYPPIDLPKHTDYNWTLSRAMNPAANGLVIEPELAGCCHWFEAGWGAWGAWPKDALRDSIVPEMPAPSPLWIRMEERVNELQFERYPGDTPPPPPDSDWTMTTERLAGAKIIAMSFPRAGIAVAVTDPGGNVQRVTSGSKPEWGPGGCEVLAGAVGTYTIAFLTESFTVQTWDGVTHCTFTEQVAPPPPPPDPDWRRPFGGSYPITCDFQCHKSRVPPSTAPGTDYATPMRTPALAVADALVYGRGSNSVSGKYVQLVCRDSAGGWYIVMYRHLNDYVVAVGAEVQAGAVIGHTGNTGNSTGPHLHMDVRRFGQFIDPEGLW